MEIIVVILLFMAVIAIAMIAFGAWLIVRIIGLGLAFLGSIIDAFRGTRTTNALPVQRAIPAKLEPTICSNRLCVTQNPPGARFCRRCGQRQARPLLVPVRRAAVW